MKRRDAFPLPPSDHLKVGTFLGKGTMPHRRKVFDHNSAFEALLRQGADRLELYSRVRAVSIGAAFALHLDDTGDERRTARERHSRRRRRDLAKLTKPLKDAAKIVKRLNSEPLYDPRNILEFQDREQAKKSLLDRVREYEQSRGRVDRFVSNFLGLPDLLEGYAAYVESCSRPLHARKLGYHADALLNRYRIDLVKYVKRETGRPHFYEAALLCQRAMEDGGMINPLFTADDLKKLYKRNPSLHKSSNPYSNL